MQASPSSSLVFVGIDVAKDHLDVHLRPSGEAFIGDGLASGDLKSTIARSFPFERIVDAHRYLEAGEQIGKIVVTV